MNGTTTMALALTPGAAARPRRGRWLRCLLWVMLVLLALSVLTAFSVLGDGWSMPLDINVNGTPLASGLDLAALPAVHKVAVAAVVAVAMLVALLVALAALVVVAVVLVPVLLLTVGLPVLVAGVVLLALFSPLLLLAWCLWRALKPSRPATMPP
jgi:hypothetical protein